MEQPRRLTSYLVGDVFNYAELRDSCIPLIVGLILEQLGRLTSLAFLTSFGEMAKLLIEPAIGVAVAAGINSPPLAIFASKAVRAAIGCGRYFPRCGSAESASLYGALIAALAGAETGRRLAGQDEVDIVILPASVIVVGGLVGVLPSPPRCHWLMGSLGAVINRATLLHPIPIGIVIIRHHGHDSPLLPISAPCLTISLG